ncbi:hypothetical protein COU04_01495, partial [bacterium (Candidatus Gribaldobacteria) CG10_big_fil_rev_8_21_14_0_10_33_41]
YNNKMDFKKFKKFLIPEEKIAGIEVDDTRLACVYLIEKDGKTFIKQQIEISLPKGIIEDGEVKDKKNFILHLNKLLAELFKKKVKKDLPAVLSLPSQKIYSQLFDFPDRINYEALEESMGLTIGFSLPLSVNESYLDWEIINEEEKKIYLSSVKKDIIDGFIESFGEKAFLPIVCETHLMSLNRAISLREKEPFCGVLVDKEGIEMAISKEGKIRFENTIFWAAHRRREIRDPQVAEFPREGKNELTLEEKKKILTNEIWRTINFYQTDNKDNAKIGKIYLIGELLELSEFKDYLDSHLSIAPELKIDVIIPEIIFGKLEKKKMEKKEKKTKERNRLEKAQENLDKLLSQQTEIEKTTNKLIGEEGLIGKEIKTLKEKEKLIKSRDEKKKLVEQRWALEKKRKEMEEKKWELEKERTKIEPKVKKAQKLYGKTKKESSPEIIGKELNPVRDLSLNGVKDNRFLIGIGAALRGFIPHDKDNFISLLPIGTEERYFHSKVSSIFNFVNSWFILMSIIFVSLFGGTYFLLSYISQNTEKQLSDLKALPVGEELQKIEKTAIEFNKNIDLMENLSKEVSPWSKLLEELKNKKINGITYIKLTAISIKDKISLEGLAGTRSQLLSFKENLMASQILTEIELPLKFVEEKENIFFTISFRVK